MELYRIEQLDMMGFRIRELFFISLDKARTEYAKILLNYRKNGELVSRGDEQHLSNPIVKRETIQKNTLKEHLIEVWYRSSYEYDEWDTSVEHLRLERLEIV